MSKPGYISYETDPLEEKILKRIPREILLASFLLAFPALFLFDAVTAAIFLMGGIVSALSFVWLKRSLSKSLFLGKKQALKSAIPLYGLRLLLILALFFIIIFFFSRKIIAFAAGLSVIIPVFLVEALRLLSQMKKWKN